jgi:hypothetical protein
MDHSDPIDTYLMFTDLAAILARRSYLLRQLKNAKAVKLEPIDCQKEADKFSEGLIGTFGFLGER